MTIMIAKRELQGSNILLSILYLNQSENAFLKSTAGLLQSFEHSRMSKKHKENIPWPN